MAGKSVIAAVALAVLLTASNSRNALAQTGTQPPVSSETWTRYNAEKKHEVAAAVLEMMIPVVGHAYAGNAKRGLAPLAVSVGGIALAVVGTTTGCRSEFMDECIDKGNTAMIAGGLLAYLGGRIWGVVSAHNTAAEHNSTLQRRLRISAGTDSNSRLALKLSFSTR